MLECLVNSQDERCNRSNEKHHSYYLHCRIFCPLEFVCKPMNIHVLCRSLCLTRKKKWYLYFRTHIFMYVCTKEYMCTLFITMLKLNRY